MDYLPMIIPEIDNNSDWNVQLFQDVELDENAELGIANYYPNSENIEYVDFYICGGIREVYSLIRLTPKTKTADIDKTIDTDYAERCGVTITVTTNENGTTIVYE